MSKVDKEKRDNPIPQPASSPDPALKRLDPLVGRWEIRGRLPGAQADTILGHVKIEWLPGGYFLAM